MTDETANLVLEHLRKLRDEVAGIRSDFREDLLDLKLRMSNVEQTVGGLQVHHGQTQTLLGALNRRMDRLDQRIESVELRVDRLTDLVRSGFAKIDERFAKLDERLERIERRLDMAPAT